MLGLRGQVAFSSAPSGIDREGERRQGSVSSRQAGSGPKSKILFIKTKQIPSWSQGETCSPCHGLFVAALSFRLVELENDGLDKRLHVFSSPKGHRTRGCPGPGRGDRDIVVRGLWELCPVSA